MLTCHQSEQAAKRTKHDYPTVVDGTDTADVAQQNCIEADDEGDIY
jgi:hypothetical protein